MQFGDTVVPCADYETLYAPFIAQAKTATTQLECAQLATNLFKLKPTNPRKLDPAYRHAIEMQMEHVIDRMLAVGWTIAPEGYIRAPSVDHYSRMWAQQWVEVPYKGQLVSLSYNIILNGIDKDRRDEWRTPQMEEEEDEEE